MSHPHADLDGRAGVRVRGEQRISPRPAQRQTAGPLASIDPDRAAAFAGDMARVLVLVSGGRITRGDVVLLFAMRHHPDVRKVEALAAILGVDRSTIQRSKARLKLEGLIP